MKESVTGTDSLSTQRSPIMNFLEELEERFGPQVAQQLTSRYGIEPEKAAGLLPRMAPFVLGGVQSQMSNVADEQTAQRLLNDHADESGLDDLDGHFERAHQREVAAQDTLGGLFGQQAPQAQAAMANQLGMSPDMIAKILPVVAPLILGAVMNKMKTGGQSQSHAGAGSPGGGGGGSGGGMDILGSILGQSGGSNILGSVLGSVLGGGGAGSNAGGGLSNKAGCLMSILGALMKAKK